MKLKNKKTGEILELCCHRSGDYRERYDSLAELNEEWEDAPEEPKEYWYIYADGDIYKDVQDDVRKDNGCKAIGNYFETKEEAEKAVEKLKAVKRLKDAGFRFGGWETDSDGDLRSVLCNRKDRVQFNNTETLAMAKDLDLLFGGGE